MPRILLTMILILASAQLPAQTGNADSRYRDYIDRYGAMAVEQQKAYGIPASITLAQGLLESAAGNSTLAREGNNHFGIKCHSSWKGETMLRDDDAPDECFRVYASAAESFRDHSIFLTGKRYRELFQYDISDYSSWATGLGRCGYATDPNYASRLITIIERYRLYDFDSGAHREDQEITEFIRQQLSRSHPVRKNRGLHFIVALPGDTYSSIAREFRINAKKLMKYNDASGDGIREWQEVYLQQKTDKGPDNVRSATIGEDETLHSVSQRYGIRLDALMKLNPGIEDKPGTRLRLR